MSSSTIILTNQDELSYTGEKSSAMVIMDTAMVYTLLVSMSITL